MQNVGAVTSTSTRTPIYKAFARGENIGDVTAKGECVGNIADLVQLILQCFSTLAQMQLMWILRLLEVWANGPLYCMLVLANEKIKRFPP